MSDRPPSLVLARAVLAALQEQDIVIAHRLGALSPWELGVIERECAAAVRQEAGAWAAGCASRSSWPASRGDE